MPLQDVTYAVARNFGGLPSTSTSKGSVNDFLQIMAQKHSAGRAEYCMEVVPNVLDLVRENLDDQLARHLMLLTHGDAAMCLLTLPVLQGALKNHVVMLASRFKEDDSLEYDYQQLSKIILYMETGRQLIIKDHDRSRSLWMFPRPDCSLISFHSNPHPLRCTFPWQDLRSAVRHAQPALLRDQVGQQHAQAVPRGARHDAQPTLQRL
jgi:hypothetical protein